MLSRQIYFLQCLHCQLSLSSFEWDLGCDVVVGVGRVLLRLMGQWFRNGLQRICLRGRIDYEHRECVWSISLVWREKTRVAGLAVVVVEQWGMGNPDHPPLPRGFLYCVRFFRGRFDGCASGDEIGCLERFVVAVVVVAEMVVRVVPRHDRLHFLSFCSRRRYSSSSVEALMAIDGGLVGDLVAVGLKVLLISLVVGLLIRLNLYRLGGVLL